MANIPIAQKTRWTKADLFVLLPVLLITTALIGCKTSSQSGISDEQKQLIALSETIPTNSPPDEHVFLPAGLDSRTKTVLELADIFMTNRDWTEFLPQKQLDAWNKRHPDESPPVIIHEEQAEAAFQLSQLGPQAKAAAPAMVQSLTNSEFLTRQWASSHKGADEQRADSMNRHWAIQVLQAIGSASPEVVPVLVHMLDVPQRKYEPYESGYEAAQALITISLNDTNVLPAVITKLESNLESPEAKNSVRVLNGIGAGANAAVPVLIQLLEHTNADDMVVNTLGKIGSDAGPAVPSLLRLYGQSQGDGNFAKRKQIVITLGKIGPAAKEAVPMLEGLRKRNYEDFEVARALWRIDPQYTPHAISLACWILQSKATPDRSNAIELLSEIGPLAKSAVPILTDIANNPNYPNYVELRPLAILAISKINGK